MTAVIFVFIPILGEYLTPQIVGGTGGVMIGNLVVNFFQAAEYTRGAAVSLLIAAFILLLLVVFRRSLSVAGGLWRVTCELLSPRARASARVALGRYGVLIYVFLFGPIALLVLFSFNANRYGTFPITGWTLQWYRTALGDYQIHDALATTLRVAAEVTVDQHRRRHGRGVPARALAAAVPRRDPHRLRAADHDPGPADRRQPARALHGHAAPAAVAADGRDRPGRLHDAVRDPARRRAAAGLRPRARARRRAISAPTPSHRLRLIVLPLLLPGDPRAARCSPSRSRSTSSSSRYFLIGTHDTLPIYIYTQVKFGITPEVNALASMLLAASLVGCSPSRSRCREWCVPRDAPCGSAGGVARRRQPRERGTPGDGSRVVGDLGADDRAAGPRPAATAARDRDGDGLPRARDGAAGLPRAGRRAPRCS